MGTSSWFLGKHKASLLKQTSHKPWAKPLKCSRGLRKAISLMTSPTSLADAACARCFCARNLCRWHKNPRQLHHVSGKDFFSFFIVVFCHVKQGANGVVFFVIWTRMRAELVCLMAEDDGKLRRTIAWASLGAWCLYCWLNEVLFLSGLWDETVQFWKYVWGIKASRAIEP